MATHHVQVRRQSARPGGRDCRVGVTSPAILCCLGLLLLGGTGCRGGVRSLSAPKWPSLGGAKPADASALASVPSSDGPIKMPSASATPYATTSTPAGYVVNDPAGGSGAGAESIQTAASDPAAVTYGVTPPIAEPASPEPSPPASAIADAAAPIAPQVGRYATLPSPPPPAEAPATPGIPPASADAPGAFAAAPPPAGPPGGGYPTTPPAPAAFPTTAGYEPAAPAAEVAVAPIAAPAVAAHDAAPPLTPIAEPSAGPPARYASRGSRYAGAAATTEPSSPALAPLPVAAAGVAGAAIGADAALGGPPSAPAAVPLEAPGGAPAVLPAAIPDGLTSPPVRRRDPGYRPGGTSSYRPADQIFVDDDPLPPSPVRTASYEVVDPIPAPPLQR